MESLPLWRSSESVWTRSWATCSACSCFEQGLQRSLPTLTTLWSYISAFNICGHQALSAFGLSLKMAIPTFGKKINKSFCWSRSWQNKGHSCPSTELGSAHSVEETPHNPRATTLCRRTPLQPTVSFSYTRDHLGLSCPKVTTVPIITK